MSLWRDSCTVIPMNVRARRTFCSIPSCESTSRCDRYSLGGAPDLGTGQCHQPAATHLDQSLESIKSAWLKNVSCILCIWCFGLSLEVNDQLFCFSIGVCFYNTQERAVDHFNVVFLYTVLKKKLVLVVLNCCLINYVNYIVNTNDCLSKV